MREQYERETPRRLWVLIQGLPPEAAVWDNDRWGWTEELLALVAELLDTGNRNNAVLHGVKESKLGKPLKVERPGKRKKGPRPRNVIEEPLPN